MAALETIIAWDHFSAVSMALDELRERPAFVVVHGVVVAEDEVYLYVAQGAVPYAEEEVYACENLDLTAVIKGAVRERIPHGNVPDLIAGHARIEKLRELIREES